jgi:hypothetical protein
MVRNLPANFTKRDLINLLNAICTLVASGHMQSWDVYLRFNTSMPRDGIDQKIEGGNFPPEFTRGDFINLLNAGVCCCDCDGEGSGTTMTADNISRKYHPRGLPLGYNVWWL